LCLYGFVENNALGRVDKLGDVAWWIPVIISGVVVPYFLFDPADCGGHPVGSWEIFNLLVKCERECERTSSTPTLAYCSNQDGWTAIRALFHCQSKWWTTGRRWVFIKIMEVVDACSAPSCAGCCKETGKIHYDV
jgi:hypothetical protein